MKTHEQGRVRLLPAVATALALSLLPVAGHADGYDEGPMGDLCLTCWGPPESGRIVTPEGSYETWKDPTPPVWNYDFGGRRQQERVRERRREEED